MSAGITVADWPHGVPAKAVLMLMAWTNVSLVAALVGTLIVLDVNGAMSFPVPNFRPLLAVFGFGSGSDELELDEIAAAQADDAAETTSRVSDV